MTTLWRFRVLAFDPTARPPVRTRYYFTFRSAARHYVYGQSLCSVRRVQLQQLVALPLGSWDQDDAREWRVLLDSVTLGDVRHTANPGARRHPATRRGPRLARLDAPLGL